MALAEDGSHVVATARLAREASRLLVDDTRFWVVSAKVSGNSVSGLGTLLSGAYVGLDVGKSTEPRRDFRLPTTHSNDFAIDIDLVVRNEPTRQLAERQAMAHREWPGADKTLPTGTQAQAFHRTPYRVRSIQYPD